MKFVLLLCCLSVSVSVWAEKAEVLYAPLTLEINDKNTSYEKGAVFDVNYTKKLCLIKGDGMLIITKKSGKKIEFLFEGEKVCTSPKIEKDPPKISLLQKAINWVKKPFVDVKKAGVSKKDFDDDEKNEK